MIALCLDMYHIHDRGESTAASPGKKVSGAPPKETVAAAIHGTVSVAFCNL